MQAKSVTHWQMKASIHVTKGGWVGGWVGLFHFTTNKKIRTWNLSKTSKNILT
jgi:hypothetical protein